MAHWLVQTNGANQEDFDQIVKALKAENAEFTYIKVKPFTHEVNGLPQKYKEMPVVLLGTVNLSKWGKKKGLKGVWWNDNFEFEAQRNVFGSEMLNFESEIWNM